MFSIVFDDYGHFNVAINKKKSLSITANSHEPFQPAFLVEK